MATDVLMPQMGESIAEGTITKWLKKVGDPVERDEPLYEISTDKVDAEIPSPASGVLKEIIIGEGETVEVKTVVARIGESGEAAAPAPAEADLGSSRDSAPAPTPPQAEPSPDRVPRQEAISAAQAAPGRTSAPGSRDERIQTRSSPLVRKIAAEHGIDITEIEGSGVHGRVTKQDILEYVERLEQPATGSDGRPAPAAPAPGAGPGVGAGDRVEPMSRMRQLIAEHMVASKRTSAHVHTFYEIDMSRVDQLRRAHQDRFVQATGGAKLSYTVFVAKAVVDALQAHPVVNASVQGTDVVYHGSIHLGIAVALDWGLIVPVIKNAQDLSMVGLAKAITDLATRARERKLNPEEIQGSTFTITNPGSFGSLIGTPIINQPNVAILGMGKVEKRVVAVDDAIGIRPRMYVVLGYDHRLIDGATGEMFLSHVTRTLENFDETAL
jgi:2-oxoglutarate dehydrogenase E2 component (dihydrolipoamide succinyltransferase)